MTSQSLPARTEDPGLLAPARPARRRTHRALVRMAISMDHPRQRLGYHPLAPRPRLHAPTNRRHLSGPPQRQRTQARPRRRPRCQPLCDRSGTVVARTITCRMIDARPRPPTPAGLRGKVGGRGLCSRSEQAAIVAGIAHRVWPQMRGVSWAKAHQARRSLLVGCHIRFLRQ